MSRIKTAPARCDACARTATPCRPRRTRLPGACRRRVGEPRGMAWTGPDAKTTSVSLTSKILPDEW